MSNIVNLRRARKAKARATSNDQADANRARHGVPKKQRLLAKRQKDCLERAMDTLRLDEK